MRKLLTSVLSAAVLAACGGGNGDGSTSGEGGLAVKVATLTNGSAPSVADIAAIKVCLSGGVLGATLQPGPGCVDLAKSPSGEWDGRFGRLRTGTYTATAEARDTADSLTFVDSREVTIVEGQTAAVLFVLNQQTTPSEIAPPQFTSIALSSLDTPKGGTIQIEVKAAGGEGALSLSGRFTSSATPATHGTLSNASAFDADGLATITYTAPEVEKWVWFVLQVTDSRGNVAEMGVVVFVGMAPDVGVELAFNLAPTIAGSVRVLNDDSGVHVYFNGKVADDRSTAPLAYQVSGPCLVNPGYAFYGGTTATQLPQKAGAADLFRLDLANEAQVPFCDVTVTVTDAEGASSALTFKGIQSTLIAPTAP